MSNGNDENWVVIRQQLIVYPTNVTDDCGAPVCYQEHPLVRGTRDSNVIIPSTTILDFRYYILHQVSFTLRQKNDM